MGDVVVSAAGTLVWCCVVVILSSATVTETAVTNPYISQHPQDHYFTNNDHTITLDCSAHGDPSPVISWFKDGQPLVEVSDKLALLSAGQLQVRKINTTRGQRSDVGNYHCTATNPLTNITVSSRTARLDVAEKPVLVQGPKNQTVLEGSTVQFQCLVTGKPTPVIVWNKLNGQIPAERSEILSDYSLKINKVDQSDEGRYVCRVDNVAGSLQLTATLQIYTAPWFVIRPIDKMVSVGQRVIIRCVAIGNPEPRVYWNRLSTQTVLFANEHVERIHVLSDGTLVIDNVQTEDVGEYSCQALSSAGSSFVNIKITLVETDQLRPPPIIYQRCENQTLPVGSVASLPCLASSEPTPVVYWFNGTNALTGKHSRVTLLQSGALQIADLSVYDSGMYTCVALSETGEVTWSSGLTVHETSSPVVFYQTPDVVTLPSAPSRPTAYNVTETSVSLSWKPSVNRGASTVHSYSIEMYSPQVGQFWVAVSDSVFDQTSYVVNNLRPNTTYVFLVRAHNSHGTSLPSAISPLIVTKGAVTITSQNVRLQSWHDNMSRVITQLQTPRQVNSTTVRLSWRVSFLRESGQPRYFEGFHILYRSKMTSLLPDNEVDRGGYSVKTVWSPLVSEYLLTDLRASVEYEIYVQPFDKMSVGPASNVVHIITPQAAHVKSIAAATTAVSELASNADTWSKQTSLVILLVSLLAGALFLSLCVCLVCLVTHRYRSNKKSFTLPVVNTSSNQTNRLLQVKPSKPVRSQRGYHSNSMPVVTCCYENRSTVGSELKPNLSGTVQPTIAEPRSLNESWPESSRSNDVNSCAPPDAVSEVSAPNGRSIPNPEAYMIRMQPSSIGRKPPATRTNSRHFEQWQSYDWL